MTYVITAYTRRQARKLGVVVKKSTNKKKKIDVFKKGKKVGSVGATGYNDYPTFIKTRGKVYADRRAMKDAKATYKKGAERKVKKKKDAMDKKRLPKEVVELGGEKITIRKGGLHQSLKVPDSYKFKIKQLNSLKQVEIGDKFKFRNRIFKMTGKLKKQIVLGINLMK